MIYVKIHKGSGSVVTAVCDSELIGKKFKEGKLCLKVSEKFYKGDLISLEEAEKFLKEAVNLNIVGKKSVDLALKLKVILEENIVNIQGVPHAQSIL